MNVLIDRNMLQIESHKFIEDYDNQYNTYQIQEPMVTD